MKYQLGDKIIILHSNEEGFIVDFINDEMLMVDVNGVQFPVYNDQIDFPYFKMFSQKKTEPQPQKLYIDQIPTEKENVKKQSTEEDGVWLYFFPKFILDVFDDEVVDLFKIYLVNKTNQEYQFHYHLKFFGHSDFEIKNQLLACNDFYIHDVSLEDINDSPSFYFEFSLSKSIKTKAEYFETSLKIKPKQIFKKIEELKQKNEPSFGYQLFTSYPDKGIKTEFDMSSLTTKGYKVSNTSNYKEFTETPRSVIDLHIQKITDHFKGLTNFEIVTLQLNELKKWMHIAIQHKMPNLIVIHGVGTGKLKDEIHEFLKTQNNIKTYTNLFHPSFGWGSTEIYFQY